MKISEQPTQWVLINAHTNSIWDSCRFALLQLTNEYVSELEMRIQQAQPIASTRSFYNINFWDAPYGWYVYGHCDIDIFLSDNQPQWTFVELDDKNDLSSYLKPEQTITAEYMSVFPEGSAQLWGSGKHTGEAFYSSEFPLSEIIAAYQTI